MIKTLYKTGCAVLLVWSVGQFVVAPVSIRVGITQGAHVTALICSAIVFCAIVIPFIFKD